MAQIGEVARERGFQVEEYHNQSFPLKSLSRRWPAFNPPALIYQLNRKIAPVLKSADVVISHGMYGAFIRHPRHLYVLHSTFAGMAEAVRAHVPRLDYLVGRYLLGSFLEGRNCRRARCLAVSSAVQQQAAKYYGVSSDVLHNCIALPPTSSRDPQARARQRAAWGFTDADTVVLVVGRREILKGRLVLGQLAGRLPAGVKLAALGSGPQVENVTCLPECPPGQLAGIYQAVDWVLVPSLYEGFGLVTLEAWAQGTPVICTPTGIIHELMGQEPAFDACVAERTDDADALLAALQRALSVPDLPERQLGWANGLLRDRFCESLFKARWGDVLTQLIR